MRPSPFRSAHVPTNAIKITDKTSDAIVYVYTSPKGRAAAVAFHGKAAKPDWHYAFDGEAARERKVRAYFEARRSRCAYRRQCRDERNAPHGLEVGHILRASWGYEQTNVDFFQVTKIVGRTMVEVRELEQIAACTGAEPWLTGKTLPRADAFAGAPIRRRVNGRSKSVRIDTVRTAFVWDGQPVGWTAYH